MAVSSPADPVTRNSTTATTTEIETSRIWTRSTTLYMTGVT